MRERLVRIRGLIIKEGWQIVRDPSNILIAFVLPVILLILFGYAISLDQSSVRIALVVEDDSNQQVMNLEQSFLSSRYFEVVTITKDRREAVPLLIASEVRGIVVIPSDFSQRLKTPGQTASIQVITDGSEPNTAKFVENYAYGAWKHWAQLEGYDIDHDKIKVLPRIWYNEEVNSHFYLVPSSIVVILTIIGALLTALVVAREWERGTMEALMSTPVSLLDIMIGKLIPYFILGLGSMLVCLLAAEFVFQVPMRGSFWVLLFSSCIYLCSTLSMGLLISTRTKNQFVAAQVALIAAFLPSFLLSGFIYEINSTPLIIQAISYMVPARYFVDILKTVFMVGNIWEVILFNLLGIVCVGSVFLILTVRKSSKRLD